MAKKQKKEKIDFKYNMGLYLGLLKRYRISFSILLVLVLLIEASHVLDRYFFKLVVDYGTEFASSSIARDAFVKVLLIVAGVYLIASFLRILFKFIHVHLLVHLEADLIMDLKVKFFNHIMGLSHSFHTSNKTGSLISRMVRSASAIESMTDVIIFNITPLIFNLAIVVISLLYFDVMSSLIIALTVIIFIAYSLYMQKVQEHSNIIKNNVDDREKALIADNFTNIDSIKYFGKEASIKTKFKKMCKKTKESSLDNWNYFRIVDSGQALILALGTFVLVYVSILSFLNNNMSLGDLVFIYSIFIGLMSPLFGFVHGIRGYYRAMADFEVLFKYAKIHNEVKETPHSKYYKIKKGKIEFKNVCFGYGKRKILRNLDLTVGHNKKIALVGHSGCGKSTLVKLLYRFYDVRSGEIIIDGVNIKDFKKESLRSEMSIVPQECALFDDTIYNNILFSNPRATRRQVMRAIKFAQLDRIINNFPEKERTMVGERGVKLSGGEKQRVSIARAILADKQVLVLDEATSALDSQTESEIQRDLEELMKGRTSIIIAHRLSTIMKADEIVVMEKGQIVQRGKHEDLIQKKGKYKKLWHLQKGGYLK